ncbi:MAG TPA: tetratricopeptide repeat protein [Candidatus Acidoferrales bacterium]|nr:tetratricopeptide repeat protein [Candidatus Acidoferrales bacterium]
MNRSLCIGLLLAVVALIYVNTFANEFTLDDNFYISLNPQVTNVSVRALFTPNKINNVYRPLTFATFALNWRLGGAQPFGFHFVNLALHAGVTVLLFMLFELLLQGTTAPTEVALVAALLFAVHPLHTEAVTSIAGRPELLAAGFLLAAWILHLKDQQIPALVCFSMALLSKESAVVFLPLVLVGDYARGKWKTNGRYALLAGVTALYLGLLWKVQGERFGQPTISWLDNPLASLATRWRILNALRVAWKYAALHVYPARLSCDYSFNAIPLYMDWRHTLLPLIASLVVIAVWIWAVRKRNTGCILAGGIYLVAFAATTNILMPTGTIMGERLAYLPSAGFCLLAALAWHWLRGRQRIAALAALTTVVAALGMRTMVRNRDWRDDLSLFSSAVKAVPGSAKMHSNLGVQYMNDGRLDEAGPEFEAALRIDSQYPDAISVYGLLLARTGNYDGAQAMMDRALKMSDRSNPNYDYMAVNFATVLMQTNHLQGALDVLNREISESPNYARAWANRAVIHYKEGQNAPARSDAEAALRLDPANKQAQNLLHVLATPAQSSSAPHR